jgi:alanyl-tRNA synthetase
MQDQMQDQDTRLKYIIADHFRTSAFIIADGVQPSGKQRGYVLRRLIRRMLMASYKLDIDISNPNYFKELLETVVQTYKLAYPEILENQEQILTTFKTESQKFIKSIDTGTKEWQKYFKEVKKQSSANFNQPGELALTSWNFYQTHGVPVEISQEIVEQMGYSVDIAELNRLIEEHQKLSQTTSAGQFKSGLGEDTSKTRRLHTATHILHQVLRDIFGNEVKQMGSQITPEKARFDISLEHNIDQNQIEQIQTEVQKVINLNLEMEKIETSPQNAKELGAIGLFGEKYGDIVSVYTLQDKIQNKVYSREFCGGPHIQNSSEIGQFKLLKVKSIGQGLKRLEFDVI